MSEMPGSNVDLIRRAYEAMARKDIPAIFGMLAPEAEISQSTDLPWGGRYRGPGEIQRFFALLTQAIDSRPEPAYFIDSGDHVVCVGRTVGTSRVSGKPFDVPVVHVWTIRDARIGRFEAYIDHPTMIAALVP